MEALTIYGLVVALALLFANPFNTLFNQPLVLNLHLVYLFFNKKL